MGPGSRTHCAAAIRYRSLDQLETVPQEADGDADGAGVVG
jgi:hypothetical protein